MKNSIRTGVFALAISSLLFACKSPNTSSTEADSSTIDTTIKVDSNTIDSPAMADTPMVDSALKR